MHSSSTATKCWSKPPKKDGGKKEEKFIIKNPGEESDCCGFSRILTGAHRAIAGNVIVSFLVTGRKDSSLRTE